MAYENYPGQQNQGYYAPVPQTNGMAIAALVASLVFAPLGIILGHIARGQIKRTGDGGRGLATAALVIGYVLTLIAIGMIVVAFGVFLLVKTVPTPPEITNTPAAFVLPSGLPYVVAPNWIVAR